MSIIDTSLGGVAAMGLSVLARLAAGGVTYRSIGGIVAPCTLEERHRDTLTITDHPVEQGAVISDHAFLNPMQVEIVIGWGAGVRIPLNQIYRRLLDLQASRKPFPIITGKRAYKDMLIESIEVTTDADSENVLRVSLSCRQVLIVATRALTLADASKQASPAQTAATQDRGTVQTIPLKPLAAVVGTPI